MVVGSAISRTKHDPEVSCWLRKMAVHVRRLASVCVGSFFLAEAGLLRGKRATTHWAFAQKLTEKYPDVNVDSNPSGYKAAIFIFPPELRPVLTSRWRWWKKITAPRWRCRWRVASLYSCGALEVRLNLVSRSRCSLRSAKFYGISRCGWPRTCGRTSALKPLPAGEVEGSWHLGLFDLSPRAGSGSGYASHRF
jgi:hypothetical protein